MSNVLWLQRHAGNRATVALLGRQERGARVAAGLRRPDRPRTAGLGAGHVEAEVRGQQAAEVLSRLPSPARVYTARRRLGQPVSDGSRPRISTSAPAHRVHRCGTSRPPEVKEPEGAKEIGGSLPEQSVSEITKSDSRDVHPQSIANALSNELPAFKELREQANAKVKQVFGEDKEFTYGPKPKQGGGTAPAYYKDGSAYFGSDIPHISQTVLNVIFETANAAQADRFRAVEEADAHGDFGGSFDINRWMDDPSELGDLLGEATDRFSRRSLVQEYFEWQSLLMAKASFEQYYPMLSGDENKQGVSSELIWENSFGVVLACKNFLEYYKVFGKTHRGAVEGALRRAGK